MLNKQKLLSGFVLLPIILVVTLIAATGFIIYNNSHFKTKQSPSTSPTPTPVSETPTQAPNSNPSKAVSPTKKITTTPTSTTQPQNSSPTATSTPVDNFVHSTSTPTQHPTSVPTTSTPTPTTSQNQTFQNGNISVTISCSSPNISLVMNATGISTSPDGTWTYIRINETGKNIYLAYDGTSSSYSGFNGATITNQQYSIRNGDLLTLQSGKSYIAKVSRGGYTSGDPTSILGATLAEVSFTINCSF